MSTRTRLVTLAAIMCLLTHLLITDGQALWEKRPGKLHLSSAAASTEDLVMLAQVPSYPLPAEGRERMAAAWSPDGMKVVYSGPSTSPAIPGSPMVLDLNVRPFVPQKINSQAAYDTSWTRDGHSIVFITSRLDDGKPIKTLLLQPEESGGAAVDLLPGQMATREVYEVEGIEQWVGPRMLAYSALVGSGGLRSLYLKKTDQPLAWPETVGRVANLFSWSPDRSHVAGQTWEGDFWIWDLRTKTFVNLPLRQEGQWRVIEDWGPDGTILFSSWANLYAYWGRSPRPQGLYQLNPQTGLIKIIARNGVMATGSDTSVSYVELSASPRLVVKSWSGTTLWSERLGEFSKGWLGQVRSYRPRFVGSFLSYRHTNGDWFVSRTATHSPRRVAAGRDTFLSWRPDAYYVALHQEGKMSVLLNPLIGLVQ